jgi:putative ABC transport system permease protein
METVWRDVVYALRVLTKAPGYAAVAILTLALGIGANTAVFSVVNAVLLKPLPYPDSDRLVSIAEWSEQVPGMSFSMANFKDLRDQSTVFESIMASNQNSFVLAGKGEPERLLGRQVSSGLFATLGKSPLLGRGFTADEDKPGTPGVVLLGEAFWERRFGRDPNIVGQSLELSGQSYNVIGVMPRALHGSWKRADLFVPLFRLEDRIGGPDNRGNHPGIYVIGRLKPGISEAQARTEVVSIAQRLAQQYPDTNAKQSMTVESLLQSYVGDLRPALILLLGAVAFVLLIACANVVNLQLSRAADRQKEVAVRMALGAKRGRLVRQLLTESVLLSLGGALLGILLAFGGIKALVVSISTSVPRSDEIGIDGPVLLFTLVIALLTGVLFGLAPAWRISSLRINDPLRENSRGTIGPRHHRLRSTLVVAEVSLALTLLVGAGLLLRSFYRVLTADAGFNRAGVMTASVPLPQARYTDDASKAQVAHHLLDALRAVPGVETATVTIPLLGSWQSSFIVEGRPEPPPGQLPSADITRVGTDYFPTMGVRLLQGRVFDERDIADKPAVCIVDTTFVADHFPTENPLGKRIKFGDASDEKEPWLEIVGVAAHVKNYGVDEESRVEVYMPFAQQPASSFTVMARTKGDPSTLAAGLRSALRDADPQLPMYELRTLADVVAEGTAERRLSVTLIGVFGALALVLAAVGIYGVMSYAVTQRTQEIGVRMALGAEQDQILKMVLRHGTTLATLGVGIGLVTAFGLAQFVKALLFNTSAADPPTFSIVPLLLLSVAAVACYLPARRATRVDPMVALRNE